MQEIGTKLLESKLPRLLDVASSLTNAEEHRGDLLVTLPKEKIREVISFLKPSYNVMMDLFALDYLKLNQVAPERFAVVYNLFSMDLKARVFLKTWINDSRPETDSIYDLYKAANWFEREVWDLFGIQFKNHPNLQRILCHVDFLGHPMRKDYPSDHYQRLKNAAPPSGF